MGQRMAAVLSLVVLMVTSLASSTELTATADSLQAVYNASGGTACWRNSAGWAVADPTTLCSWFGVQCSSSGEPVSLALAGNGLCGSLSLAICNITSLQSLDVAQNNISGSIPACIGNLVALAHLDLSSNNFTGPIPASLGNMLSLVFANISKNHLSGSLPSQLFSPASSLVYFNATQNGLTGSLPASFCSAKYLSVLSLALNNFTDAMPACIGQLQQLTILQLGFNNLQGLLPPSLCNLTALNVLDLTSNGFTGPIFSCTQLKNLTDLRFSNNRFAGTIPATLCTLTSLTLLYLDRNSLSGSFPACFMNLTNLSLLDTSSNSFLGLLPAVVCSTPNLSSLYLSSNGFSGPIPSCYYNMSRLQVLSLGLNKLTGALPRTAFNNWRNLTTLYLFFNQLSGLLPSLLPLTSLVDFRVNNNKLEGDLTNLYLAQPTLQYLYLSNNSFTGHIPASLAASQLLREIGLASNDQLSGSIDVLCGLPNLEVIDLRNNSFTNPAVANCFSSQVRVLLLGSNRFTNPLPVPTNTSSLYFLDLSANDFIGNFPWSLLSIPSLRYITFSNNKFTGLFDTTVAQWSRSLEVIICAQNKFTGSLPPDLGYLPRLTTFIASSNQLKGLIPPTVNQLVTLQQLDLSQNQLTGVIPSFTYLPKLQRLILRENLLSGRLNQSLFENLPALVELKLSFNRLACDLPNVTLTNFNKSNNDLSVLEGNLFSCPIPYNFVMSDQYGDNYQCGSSSLFVVTLIASGFFVLLLLVVFLRLIVQQLRHRSKLRSRPAKYTAFSVASKETTQMVPDEGETWPQAVKRIVRSTILMIRHGPTIAGPPLARFTGRHYSQYWEIIIMLLSTVVLLLFIPLLMPVYSFGPGQYVCRYLWRFSIAYLSTEPMSAAWSWLVALFGGFFLPCFSFIALVVVGILLGYIGVGQDVAGTGNKFSKNPLTVLVRRVPKHKHMKLLLNAHFEHQYGAGCVNRITPVPCGVEKLQESILVHQNAAYHGSSTLEEDVQRWSAMQDTTFSDCAFVTFTSADVATRCIRDHKKSSAKLAKRYEALRSQSEDARAFAIDHEVTTEAVQAMRVTASLHDRLTILALKNMYIEQAPWPEDVLWQNAETHEWSQFFRRVISTLICTAVIFLQIVLNIVFVFSEDETVRLPTNYQWVLLTGFALIHEILHHALHPIAVRTALSVLREVSRRRHVQLAYRLSVFMGTCNAVFVPLVAIFLFNPSCFLFDLKPSQSQTNTINFPYCSHLDALNTCATYAQAQVNVVTTYPFEFNRGCLSSATLQYTPAFLGVLFVRGIMVPMWWLLLDFSWSRRLIRGIWSKIMLIPGMWRCLENKVELQARFHAAGLQHAIHVAHVLDTLTLTICIGVFSPFVLICGVVVIGLQHGFRWYLNIPEDDDGEQTESNLARDIDASADIVPMPWSCFVITLAAYSIYMLAYFFMGAYPGKYLLIFSLGAMWIVFVIAVRWSAQRRHEYTFGDRLAQPLLAVSRVTTLPYECPSVDLAKSLLDGFLQSKAESTVNVEHSEDD